MKSEAMIEPEFSRSRILATAGMLMMMKLRDQEKSFVKSIRSRAQKGGEVIHLSFKQARWWRKLEARCLGRPAAAKPPATARSPKVGEDQDRLLAASVPIPADALEVFTDGACEPNPGLGGWGFVVYRGLEEVHSASGGEAETTNNRMELLALIQALRWLDPRRPAVVWSDSQYCVRGCNEWRAGWKAKGWRRGVEKELANAELWQTLDALLDTRVVEVRWVRGHAGTVGNERADELAAIGRQSVLEAA